MEAEKKFRLIESTGDWTGIVKPEHLEKIKSEGPQVYSELSDVFPARYLVRLYKNSFVAPEDEEFFISTLSEEDLLDCFIEDTFTGDQCGCSISIAKEIKGAIGDGISLEEIEESMRERLDLMNETNVFDEHLISAIDFLELSPDLFTEEYLESLKAGQSWKRTIEFEVQE